MILPPPHHVIRDFLGARRNAELLEWTLDQRPRYRPATLASGAVDPGRRVSELLGDLGPAREWFADAIHAAAPALFAGTGTEPFAIEYLEMEIAAHGDGAHFATHTDIPVGWGRRPLGGDRSGTQDRLLSVVYYYHREPRGFSGGQLRLHRFGSNGAEGDFVDVEPANDSLVVFPSWVSHEVRAVACPSRRFEDYRFAVNCWLCRKLPLSRPLSG